MGKEERQETLQNIFHFQCRCTACENNFPTATDLKRTFSDMATSLVEKSDELNDLCNIIVQGMNSIDSNNILTGANKSLGETLRCDAKKLKEKRNLETLKKILAILDKCNDNINSEIKLSLEKENVENCLQLYYQKQRLASIFLKPPHGIFISGRGAITDCLMVNFGNISYGTSRMKLF